MRYRQDLQVAIRERLRKLMIAHPEDLGWEIRFVADWVANHPALRSILTAAERVEPDLDFLVWDQNLQKQRMLEWPTNTEAGRASLIWHLLRHIAEADRTGPGDPMLSYISTFGGNLRDAAPRRPAKSRRGRASAAAGRARRHPQRGGLTAQSAGSVRPAVTRGRADDHRPVPGRHAREGRGRQVRDQRKKCPAAAADEWCTAQRPAVTEGDSMDVTH